VTHKAEDLINSDADQYRILADVERALSGLAHAFGRTGNINLSDELFEMSNDVSLAASTLKGNSSERLYMRLEETEQAAANMISAMVAGITVSESRAGSYRDIE